jgi:hypothetical protein
LQSIQAKLPRKPGSENIVFLWTQEAGPESVVFLWMAQAFHVKTEDRSKALGPQVRARRVKSAPGERPDKGKDPVLGCW